MKKIVSKIMTCGIALALSALPVFSQTPAAKAPEQAPETPRPIELPNFIIEGVEQLNVRTGIKQFPIKSVKLSESALDSLNSLEKQQSALLPADPLPVHSVKREYSQGFVRGGFGLFSSADITAGYGLNTSGYELYGNAGIDASAGDAQNSDYRRYFLSLNSDFIAPDKYFIFGGSRTRTNFTFKSADYNLYSANMAQPSRDYFDRNSIYAGLKCDVDGNYNNIIFQTGAAWETLQLSTEKDALAYTQSSNAFDNKLRGYLQVKNMWHNYLVAGNLDLDIHNVRGDAANFIQADVSASYFDEMISLLVNVGLQNATNTADQARSGLLLSADLEYRISKLLTMKAGFMSGLDKNSLTEVFQMNPYATLNTKVDYAYNLALIKGVILYHPFENLALSGGLKWRVADRLPVFGDSNATEFSLLYEQGTYLQLLGEAIWNIDDKSYISGNLEYCVSGLNDYDGAIPYMAPIKASAEYRKEWIENFGTKIGFSYIGAKRYSLKNEDEIDSYFDLKVSADYRLNNQFLFYVKFDNLTNSNIYIWNNYKERSLFAQIGVLWQF